MLAIGAIAVEVQVSVISAVGVSRAVVMRADGMILLRGAIGVFGAILVICAVPSVSSIRCWHVINSMLGPREAVHSCVQKNVKAVDSWAFSGHHMVCWISF